MPYVLSVAPRVNKVFERIKKRDKETYKEILAKLAKISQDPHHFGKPMRSGYKGLWEVHVKNNVMYYQIREANKAFEIVAYLDHDLL